MPKSTNLLALVLLLMSIDRRAGKQIAWVIKQHRESVGASTHHKFLMTTSEVTFAAFAAFYPIIERL